MAYERRSNFFVRHPEQDEAHVHTFFHSFCHHAEWFSLSRYYRLFLYHYSLSLRTASFLMINSTWTQNHVDAILRHHDLLVNFLYLSPPLLAARFLFLSNNAPLRSTIVYPPCDTREMEKFPLMPRERVILSVAQFRFVSRPEKDRFLHSMNLSRNILNIGYHPTQVAL
jgi:alpha-1,2-mannosyltransferase